MLNRRLGALAVAVVAGALGAATAPAFSCGWNGCGYSYGYQASYYVQPVYYYQQPVYVQPVYYQQPVYVQPVYYQQPVYAQPTYYSSCCKGPNLWDALFGNNCCAQPAYQPVAAPAYAPAGYDPYENGYGLRGGYIDDSSMYGPGYRYGVAPVRSYDPYLARPPRYVRPRYRRGHVVYRQGYRPYVRYRARPHYRRYPYYVR